MTYNPTQRIQILSIVVVIASILFIGRLFTLQVLYGEEYREDARRQYESQTGTLFERASIFFTKKNGDRISGATTAPSYFIAINPEKITDADALFKSISPLVPTLTREKFDKHASRTSDSYEVIVRGISPEEAKAVRALRLANVWIFQENYRLYPGGTLGAHIVGLIAKSKETGDAFQGRYGLERFYEETLVHREENLYSNFFADVLAGAKKATEQTGVEGDIVTSIEPTVQGALEKELSLISEKWHPELAGGIIIEPKTGRIIALAANPTFDPNKLSEAKSSAVFSNPLVENVYEMGSIVKPLTIALALDSGAITASTTYKDEGFRVIDGKRIQNFDGKARGVVAMQEVLNQSLNTGVVFAIEKMGLENFSQKMRTLGLGEKTGIDLPSEARGLIKNLESTRKIEHATASYGQGIALTPIAIVRALSALGNGGLLISPHIGETIIQKRTGTKIPIPTPEPMRVLKPETSREISRMLTGVVDTALAHGKVKLEHHSVAAKTGTAQISTEKGGGYAEDRYLHSFFGYFPSYEPRFLVFLFSKDPRGAEYASETLTEPFMNLTNFLIHYYEIPPDR